MAATTFGARSRPSTLSRAIRAAILVLTLATAWIHLTLGGWMFTLNALGYATLAAAMVLPGPLGRIRWLSRLGLLAFTLATIGGWVAFGARFDLAYLDKGLEVVLVVLLAVELWRDGGIGGTLQHGRALLATLTRRPNPGASR